jgi:hypothetical protein
MACSIIFVAEETSPARNRSKAEEGASMDLEYPHNKGCKMQIIHQGKSSNIQLTTSSNSSVTLVGFFN